MQIRKILHEATLARVDLNPNGLVSVAFRGEAFAELVEHAPGWCDFLPVDWMVWSFFKHKEYCTKCGKAPKKTVEHIGKVSSRYGRVEGAEEYDKQVKEIAKKKAAEKRAAEKKKRLEAKAARVAIGERLAMERDAEREKRLEGHFRPGEQNPILDMPGSVFACTDFFQWIVKKNHPQTPKQPSENKQPDHVEQMKPVGG